MTDAAAVEFLEKLDATLAERVDEATYLRRSVLDKWDGLVPETPADVMVAIRQCRASLDRVELILAVLIKVRARVQQHYNKAKWAGDDAWDKAATSQQGFAMSDPAPRERYAQYQLASMAQTIEARRLENALVAAEAARQTVELQHRGLRDLRYDLESTVRLITIETRLET